MDRRTFLKSLLAVGAISRMPISLAIASDAEVDAVFEEFQDIWGLFIVDDHGTVYSANFEEPLTRRDAYPGYCTGSVRGTQMPGSVGVKGVLG